MKTILYSLTISAMLFAYSFANAQQNNIKLGLGGLLFGNVSLQYEYSFSDNKSINVNVGILVPRELPTALYDINSSAGTSNIELNNRLSGLSIVPELRFYLGNNSAPRGFYVAPYFRYGNYELVIDETYASNKATVDVNFNQIGGGIQLGAQWLISDQLSIDWYFLGLGFNRNTLDFTIVGRGEDIDTINFAEWEDDAEKEFNESTGGFFPEAQFTSGDDFLSATIPFFALGIKTGLAIGYAF